MASGIAQDVISLIETGRTPNPSWRTVKALADALELDPVDVFPVVPARAGDAA